MTRRKWKNTTRAEIEVLGRWALLEFVSRAHRKARRALEDEWALAELMNRSRYAP